MQPGLVVILLLLTKASNAYKASESAYRQANTMLPGMPAHNTLRQLGAAFRMQHHEDHFIRTVVELGYALPIPVSDTVLPSLGQKQHYVSIRHVAEHVAQVYPQNLLAGCTLDEKETFHSQMESFWMAFRNHNPNHDVFTRFGEKLRMCIPVKIHADEGTGLRRSAVMQLSWGPCVSHSPSSLDRYFFWSCMGCDNYKQFHRGYELGNPVLDELCAVMAAEARDLYLQGFVAPGISDRLHMVWIGLEGDLPAQARVQHLVRQFSCLPNKLCPWCDADDREVPHSDLRSSAKWKETVSLNRPWTNEGPFAAQVPGAGHETWLAKDLFHLCHLGAIRGFAVNVLCYLVSQGVFAPCRIYGLEN